MESDSDNVMNSDNHKMDTKIEIKEESNETLTQVKFECEEFETVFISSHNVKDSFSEMCNKMDIKSEPCWTKSSSTEIKQESEMPSAAGADLENEIKETSSHAEVQTGDVTAEETSRLYTESMCRNSNSTDSGENNDHSYSRQPQILEQFEQNVLDSALKGCSSVQNSDTSDMSEICEKKFIFVPTLCKVDKLYPCEICCKKFLQISHLKQHKTTHERKRPYVCNICDRSFIRASHLKLHVLTHDGKRPHVCEICNRGFSRELHLKEHKLIHTGNSPHRCEICNKSYTQSANLIRHKLTHESKRPHVCEICNKSFVLASDLNNHKLTHEDRKPYTCDICKKCFSYISTLKKHTVIHDGKREHTCEVCKKCFVRISQLKKHKLTHEFKRPLKCDNCNKLFAYASSLKRHKLTHEA